MRRVILVILTVISLMGCKQTPKEEKKNDLQEANLKGKVKSVRQTPYYAVEKFGEIVKDTLKETNNVDFENENSFYILYNEKGNLIEEKWYSSINKEYTYIYKDEKLVEIKGKNSFFGESKNAYIYDELGNLTELSTYNADGSLKEKSIYKYDDRKNKVETNKYNSDGTLKTKLTYKYDDRGNGIEINSYNSEGSLNERYTYKYDDKGNPIEEKEYYSPNSKRAETTLSIFAAFSKLNEQPSDDELRKIFNPDGSMEFRYTYEYNENGEKIEKKEYISNGNLRSKKTYTYEYDKYGNWVKRITNENDKPKFIAEREIQYYE